MAREAPSIRTLGKIHWRVTYKGNGNSISRRKPLPSPMCHSDNYSVTASALDGCDRGKRMIFDSEDERDARSRTHVLFNTNSSSLTRFVSSIPHLCTHLALPYNNLIIRNFIT